MTKKRKIASVMEVLTVLLAVILVFAGKIGAGELNPPGPPGSTMKTLDEIPPTWSQKLPAAERFVLVLDGEAVLDKETGLVWEKSPDTTRRNWFEALVYCYMREVANRKGWRLPAVEELASLVDNDFYNPALPPGHPFINVQSSAGYWSSATWASTTDLAYNVDMVHGGVGGGNKSSTYYCWCVRGGLGHDAY
jgi:hypothetical protein